MSTFLRWAEQTVSFLGTRDPKSLLQSWQTLVLESASLVSPYSAEDLLLFAFRLEGTDCQELLRHGALPRGVTAKTLLEALPFHATTTFHQVKLPGIAKRSWACVPLYQKDSDIFIGLYMAHPVASYFTSPMQQVITVTGQILSGIMEGQMRQQELIRENLRVSGDENEAHKRLARDLHDGPAQQVAAMTIRANFARKQVERNPARAIEELIKLEEMGRQTTKDIRLLLFLMRPLVLETRGLGVALHSLADRLQEGYNLLVPVEFDLLMEQVLDEAAQRALFLIVEEATKNIIKHASARNVWIRALLHENEFVLEVEDDGVGFNIGELQKNYDLNGSLGLTSMRERAEIIGGRFEIESREGHGTHLRVVLPRVVELNQQMIDEALSFYS